MPIKKAPEKPISTTPHLDAFMARLAEVPKNPLAIAAEAVRPTEGHEGPSTRRSDSKLGVEWWLHWSPFEA
jgi:hypothetical protein